MSGMMPYRTIASTLRNRIRKGRYAVGEMIPVRMELMQEFGVARATLDRSILLLVQEGWLHSRRGSGTVVARNHAPFRVAAVGDYNLSPMPRHPGIRLTVIDPDDLVQRSERQRLGQFEGLIWHLPSTAALGWAREWQGKLPQIVVNRSVPGFEYVSTDHRGAIERHVALRLSELPAALPVYLAMPSPRPLVDELRQEGFRAACSQVRRHYEVLPLAEDFEANIQTLHRRLPRTAPATHPLLLVSGTFLHTGAVMVWRRMQELQWKRDVWYSDFDDTFPPSVWGVRVTTFVQDYRVLFRHALEGLYAGMKDKRPPVQELIDPVFFEGDT